MAELDITNISDQVSGEVSSDPLVQQLTGKLMQQSDAISSSATGIESTVGEAIKGVQKSQQATAKRIESAAERGRRDILSGGESALTDFAEARSGFGTVMAGLRRVVETTDKELKDLDMRKEEMLLAGEADAASQISQLQVKQLEMKQNAMQQAFNNLLAVSSFGMQAYQFEKGQAESNRQFNLSYELEGEKFQLQKDQQSFTEKQAMSGIALEFGLDVQPGDTIDTIVDRAAATGFMDEKRALELEQMRSSIKSSNAQAARALQQIEQDESFDDVSAGILANALIKGDTFSVEGLNLSQKEQVYKEVEKRERSVGNALNTIASGVESQREFDEVADRYLAEAGLDPRRFVGKKAAAYQYIGSGFKGDDQDFGEGIYSQDGIKSYLELGYFPIN